MQHAATMGDGPIDGKYSYSGFDCSPQKSNSMTAMTKKEEEVQDQEKGKEGLTRHGGSQR